MLNIFEGTMAHMTYIEIEKAAEKKTPILFPVGVIEEHGPHLPLAVDAYGSYLQSRAVKSELERKGIRILITPPFYWGVNLATAGFGGSFTCRKETVVLVLFDLLASLKRWGFEQVFVINHHLDSNHIQAVDQAIQKARNEIGTRIYWIMDRSVFSRLGFKGDESRFLFHESLMPPGPAPQYLDIHAEGYETSLIWHFLPELIHLDVWKTLKSTKLTTKDLLVWRDGGSKARKITPQGYFGDPSTANPERGRKEIEDYGKVAAEVIEAFLQGRYSPP